MRRRPALCSLPIPGHNITFIAGEVREPRRTIPLALFLGTVIVITLYVLANVAYICLLPLDQIQNAPDGRVGTAAIATVFGPKSVAIMAVAIMISTFGCVNGLVLSGARLFYAMARDGLFFKAVGVLNKAAVPANGLIFQCAWAVLLVLPRTVIHDSAGGPDTYGNVYDDLLDYTWMFVVLIFYILCISGLFVLRIKRPDADRPYRAFGYPVVPALYVIGASVISVVLFFYKFKRRRGRGSSLCWRVCRFICCGRAAIVPAAAGVCRRRGNESLAEGSLEGRLLTSSPTGAPDVVPCRSPLIFGPAELFHWRAGRKVINFCPSIPARAAVFPALITGV